MARIEVVDSYFFPAAHRIGVVFNPAPVEAVRKRDELKTDWLSRQRVTKQEVPQVALQPAIVDGVEGYYVQTRVMYRP